MASSKTIWLKNPLAVFSEQLCPGGIVVKGSIIIELLNINQQPSVPVDCIFDATKYVITPGLINIHHHFYQNLTRAFPSALDKPLFPWLKSLYPVWAKLQPDNIIYSSRLALAELLLSGCTTAADHHYLFPKGLESTVDLQVDAANKLGMRMTVTRGSMCLGEEQGGLPPQSTIQTEDAIIEIGRAHV